MINSELAVLKVSEYKHSVYVCVRVCVFTREEVVDSHTVFLFSVNSEGQTVEVYSVVLSVTSHIQQMPPDLLVPGDQQTRKRLCHITIYCYGKT